MPAGTDEVATLHAEVDREARHLTLLHAERLACRKGCHQCCVDELTVFDVEAEVIRKSYAVLLREERPHPAGKCAFLDEQGGCRIYPHRPYVCRTQGLPLRWLVEDEPDDDTTEWVEHRDICTLNDHGAPLEGLAAQECWTLGPYEARLATLQAGRPHDERLTRVRLRDLFVQQFDQSSRSQSKNDTPSDNVG